MANKYNARKVGEFDSKLEKERADFLIKCQEKKLIASLEFHPTYQVTPDGWPRIKYIPDAQYIDVEGTLTGQPGSAIVEDTKGVLTDVFRIKAKLFRGKYPKLRLFLVKSNKRKKGKVIEWKADELISDRKKKTFIQGGP